VEALVSDPCGGPSDDGADGGELERFTSGGEIVVDTTAIERELASLWRRACRGVHATRAVLWNLVVRADGDDVYSRAKRLIDAISPACPARVLVLRADAPGEGPELEARIEANFHRPDDGGRLLGSEEVTLSARGRGEEHFPSLVRSLLLPDLPSALYWAGAPPRDARAVRALAEGADRLIVDTGDLASELDLVSISQLCELATGGGRCELIDLGWLRLGPVRLLLASLFDPPVGAAPLLAARRVRLDCARHGAATAVLLLGWLACRLGWGRPQRQPADRGRSWLVPRPGGQVELEIAVRDVDAGRDGIYQLAITSESGEQFSIADAGPGAQRLNATGLPTRVLAAPERSDAELLVGALGLRGSDPMFGHALGCAVELEG
jgi:glucose-6-phosphate dehydrogenase assembly protein OpcA